MTRKAWGIRQHRLFLEKFANVPLDKLPTRTDTLLEAVIVEPRVQELENLELVCRNVAYYLPHAAIAICCSLKNLPGVLRFATGTNIHVMTVCEENITRDEYSEFLTRPQFWDQFISEDPKKRVLIFQTDTGLRKNAILDFMHLDYIGANWPWNGRVGNGGFSLRCPRAAKEICQMFKYEAPLAEDLFFSYGMEVLKKKMATSEEAKKFSVEYDETAEDPMGFHQGFHWWDPAYTHKMFSPAPTTAPAPPRILRATRIDNGEDVTEWARLGQDATGTLYLPEPATNFQIEFA